MNRIALVSVRIVIIDTRIASSSVRLASRVIRYRSHLLPIASLGCSTAEFMHNHPNRLLNLPSDPSSRLCLFSTGCSCSVSSPKPRPLRVSFSLPQPPLPPFPRLVSLPLDPVLLTRTGRSFPPQSSPVTRYSSQAGVATRSRLVRTSTCSSATRRSLLRSPSKRTHRLSSAQQG